ncbi:MAG: tetratricopeptide repeat protein [Acidobacteriota bacterium]
MKDTPKLHVVDLEVREGSDELTVAWREMPGTAGRVVSEEQQERIAGLVKAVQEAESKDDPRVVAAPRLALGQELYRVLDGDGDRALAQRRQAADQEGQPVRVVVRLLGPALAQHPAVGWRWELMAEGKEHACLGTVAGRVELAVQLGSVTPDAPAVLPTGQLRILFMAFSPEDVEPVLDYEGEEEAFIRALTDYQQSGRVRLRVVEEGNLNALERALKTSPVDVLHLSGHGNLTSTGPRLAMEDEMGDCERVGPEELWKVLRRPAEPPRLVVISCCHSTDDGGGFPSLAAQLVAAGVQSVVGWVRPVFDSVATQAAKDFYDQLCGGTGLAEAVGFARNELREADAEAARTGKGLVSGAWGTLQSMGRDGAGFRLDTDKKVKGGRTVSESVYGYLGGTGQVRILEQGFVGRRRELQRLVRLLRTGKSRDGQRRAGALVWGMKGVGKSCLIGRAVARHVEDVGTGHGLVVLHGELNEAQVLESFTAAAVKLKDDEAEKLLQRTDLSVAQRVGRLLSSQWLEERVVIILDDFEQNLTEQASGPALVEPWVAELLAALLPPCRDGAPSVLVTSTAVFALPEVVADALAFVELGSLELASVRKLWMRGRESGELRKVAEKDWQALADRLGRNARVLDWARQLLGGSTPAEVVALLDDGEAPPEGWNDGGASEEAQAELATVYLRSLAFSRAEAEVGEEARIFVERARVYDRPVPRSALDGLADGLTLDLEEALPALSNLGLLEVGRQREDRVWRVSPLVVPEFRAEEPVRWHGVAAEYWGHALEAEDGWSFELAVTCWQHALTGRSESWASRMARRIDVFLYNQGARAQNDTMAQQNLSVFPDSVFALQWAGDAARHAGRGPEGLEHLTRALSLAENRGDIDEEFARLLTETAGVLQAQGDLPEARKLLERSLEIKRQVLGTELHSNYASSLHALAGVLQAQGDLPEARKLLERSLKIKRQALGTELHPDYATSLHQLAGVLRAQGDLPEARKVLERSLDIKRQVLGTELHPSYSASLHALAGVLQSLGDLPKARALLERSLDIQRQVLGTELHPDYSASLHSLAGVFQAQGDLPEARKLLERSLHIDRQVLGTELHPSYSASLHALAGVLRAQGNLPEARKLLERSLDIQRQVFGTELHPSYATSLDSLGGILFAQADRAGARQRIERALEIKRCLLLGDAHPEVAISLANLASVEASDGDFERAVCLSREAMGIQERVFGTLEHPSVAENEMNLAVFLLESGRREKGQQHAQHAIAVLKRMAPNHSILQQLGMSGGPVPSEGGVDFASLLQATLAARLAEQPLSDETLALLAKMAEAGDVPAAIASFLRTAAQPGQQPVIPEGLPEEVTIGLRQATEALIRLDAQAEEATGT